MLAVAGDKTVTREWGGAEQERRNPASGMRIENGVKIVKNMWG